MYESQNEHVILNRMLSKITSPVYKGEGSFVWDVLSPVANEFTQRYVDLDMLLKIPFPQDSYGEFLDKIGKMFGVPRKLADKAIGTVTFNGTNEILISANTLVTTARGYQYKTDDDCVITDGTATVAITAVNPGKAYNMPAMAVNKLCVGTNGITAVFNSSVIDGGTEDEIDDDYRKRILLKAQTPATSGNVYHYRQWALETDGVGDAKPIPTWNGPGTVKVVIINSDKKGASNIIIDACKAHIEEERPVGANVTVISATELPINISVSLSLNAGVIVSTAISDVEKGIVEYLKSIAFNRDYVSYAKVGGIILDTVGVLDHTNLLINNGTTNVPIGSEQVAVLGAFTNV